MAVVALVAVVVVAIVVVVTVAAVAVLVTFGMINQLILCVSFCSKKKKKRAKNQKLGKPESFSAVLYVCFFSFRGIEKEKNHSGQSLVRFRKVNRSVSALCVQPLCATV